MIKNKSTVLKIILLLFIFSSYSFAEDMDIKSNGITDKFIQEQLNSLNINELELVLEDIVNGNEGNFSKIDVKETILSMIKGKKTFDMKIILSQVSKLFFKEIYGNLALISQILIITVACSILTNLQTTFEKDTVSQLAHYACYIILSMLIINSFTQALDLGRKTVTQMVGFMQVILPILLTLLTAVGGPSTKLLFHPIVIGTVNIIGSLVKDLIFPLILFSFIIGIISNISHKIQFSQLTELIREIIVVVVSASLTVFIGIITMYGIGTKVDGITIRTAKFAVDNFIPIIGKFLSDAVETVVGCSAILKNGIGIIGLVSLFLICVTPAIKIVVLLFVYKGIAALIQPIAGTSITNCFDEVGKALLLILVGMLSVATMFFITITIIVEAGNATLMFR